MPRAFLKTKNRGGHKVYMCSECNKPIEAGQDYYTWKFNRGERYFLHAEHGAPRRSLLGTSNLGALWDAVDTLDLDKCKTVKSLQLELKKVAKIALVTADEYQAAAENIEAAFPSGNTTSRACHLTAGNLSGWAVELKAWEPTDKYGKGDDLEAYLEGCRSEALDLISEEPGYAG